MKATIEVANRKEAKLLKSGLAQPDVRALVLVMGALSELPSQQAKARALRYVSDLLDEKAARTAAPGQAEGMPDGSG